MTLQHVNVKLLLENPARGRSRAADSDLSRLDSGAGVRRAAARRGRLSARAGGSGRDADRPSGGLQRRQHRRPAGRSLQPQSGRGWIESGSLDSRPRARRLRHASGWKRTRGLAESFASTARKWNYSSTTGCSRRTTRHTRQAADAEFQAFAKKLFQGSDYSLAYNNEPRRLFGATLRASRSFSVADLLKNLA